MLECSSCDLDMQTLPSLTKLSHSDLSPPARPVDTDVCINDAIVASLIEYYISSDGPDYKRHIDLSGIGLSNDEIKAIRNDPRLPESLTNEQYKKIKELRNTLSKDALPEIRNLRMVCRPFVYRGICWRNFAAKELDVTESEHSFVAQSIISFASLFIKDGDNWMVNLKLNDLDDNTLKATVRNALRAVTHVQVMAWSKSGILPYAMQNGLVPNMKSLFFLRELEIDDDDIDILFGDQHELALRKLEELTFQNSNVYAVSKMLDAIYASKLPMLRTIELWGLKERDATLMVKLMNIPTQQSSSITYLDFGINICNIVIDKIEAGAFPNLRSIDFRAYDDQSYTDLSEDDYKLLQKRLEKVIKSRENIYFDIPYV